MRPRIGRVVASPRKSVACTSLRTSRYLIRNSSCFTNDCVAADKNLIEGFCMGGLSISDR